MPNWRLCNTLPMFKIVFTQSKTARLDDLVWTYAAWFDHVPHDALGDANALIALSISIGEYKKITRLSMSRNSVKTRSITLNQVMNE
ncbi:hypothetical protein LTR37_000768 [Vermiconidia calcicola]|uniref:Uncharacterized protein n=1 Tax=Vermiconidia calcicola TaxID=1690605 RepID=A0ACC3NYK2_9PEZI|nr:hypothetical protein LTR37_000768 [Vermiconidia calcicola]